MEGALLQTQWGWQIALYLFLGGLSAGTLFVSAFLAIKAPNESKGIVCFCSWTGTILLVVGVLLLLSETSMPGRAVMLWKSFVNFDSWMAFGAWLLFCGIGIFGIFAILSLPALRARLAVAKAHYVLAVIVLPLSFGIAAYTGILLGVLSSHPLWNTWLLPVLFTISAFDTGVALVGIRIRVADVKSQAAGAWMRALPSKLEKATCVLVALEACTLCALLFGVSASGEVGALSVRELTTGSLSVWFWAAFVVLGLAVPLAISIVGLTRKSSGPQSTSANAAAKDVEGAEARAAKSVSWASVVPVAGACLCLVGGCALRFLVLLAGLPISM